MSIKSFFFTFAIILPFIITAFFFISSLISSSTTGIFVLIGILLSSIITIITSKTEFLLNGIYDGKVKELYDHLPENIKNFTTGEIVGSNKDKIIKSLKHCNVFTLGESPISYLPLSTHIYSFIFGYFVYVMSINNVLAKNWFLILSLSVILVVDGYYRRDACVGNYIAIPIIIGLLSGIGWAILIGSKNHMIPSVSQQNQCSAQKSRFNCRIKRTGEVISVK
jgi:hypothetical protein